LRKLEGVVLSLGSQVSDDTEDGSKSSPKKATEGTTNTVQETSNDQVPDQDEIARVKKELREMIRKKREQAEKNGETTGLENRFGRLVVEEGRSRYINASFWANLSDEVGEIQKQTTPQGVARASRVHASHRAYKCESF